MGAGVIRNALHPAELFALVREAVKGWIDDDASSMGAALAYYTLFSIAPLLVIVIALAGAVFGEQAARGEVMSQLAGLVGSESARAIEDMLQAVHLQRHSPWATALGIGALLLGATTVFGELQQALNRIWRSPLPGVAHTPAGLWKLVRTRLLSLGIILCMGFLSLVSLVFNAALSALSGWWTPWFGEASWIAHTADFAISLSLLTVMFAMLYKWMPYAKVHWREVWIGAALTALLFAIGKAGIGLYIGRSSVTSVFGAAASLVILMIWVYYSAQIFLFGAELTWAYAKRRRPAAPAQATAAAAPTNPGP
jgi:membrane protein